MTRLEHVNVTVPDATATAAILCDLLNWKIRWEGAALNDGWTVHVGTGDSYLALYTPREAPSKGAPRHVSTAALNHIGIVVDDLEAIEKKVRAAGYTPHSHADYEPGRRFYFEGPDGVEYEMVCYD